MTHPLHAAAAVTRGEGLTDQAYLVLRNAILDNLLPPGTKLSVPEIARQLNISRSPAREAVARIQSEGLADFTPNRGAVVSRIDLVALAQIYDIREVLEGLASRLATERVDDAWIDELDALWSEHARSIEADDIGEHIRLDGEFHQRIRDAAGNLRLSESLESLQGQIRLAMVTTSRRGGGAAAAIAEHRGVIDAIRARDGDLAERIMKNHIRRLHDSLSAASDEDAASHGAASKRMDG